MHRRALAKAHAGEIGLRHVDLHPELRRLKHRDDDAAGGNEIAGTHAHDFHHRIGGRLQFGFAQAGIELGDAALGFAHATARGIDILAPESFAGQRSSSFGLP